MAKQKTTVESIGRKEENDKSKQNRQQIEQMKKRAAEDRKKAEAVRKKTGTAAKPAAGKETLLAGGAALAAGLLGGAKGKGKKKKKRALRLVLLAALVLAALFVYWKFYAGAGATQVSVLSQGIVQTNLDFQSAILGESREKQMYVVLEQDVTVETRVTQSLLNLSVFEKSKTIHSKGTGYYAIDLSTLTENSIRVDDSEKNVVVTVPHAILYVLDYDVTASTFEDTQGGILALGELKLTMEQQNEIQKSIDAAMHEVLETEEMFAFADEKGALMVYELFQPLVAALSDEYTLEIVMPEAE